MRGDFDEDEIDDDYDVDDLLAEFDDCAMGRDGQCGKAGSEECEFECPRNRPPSALVERGR